MVVNAISIAVINWLNTMWAFRLIIPARDEISCLIFGFFLGPGRDISSLYIMSSNIIGKLARKELLQWPVRHVGVPVSTLALAGKG